MSYYKFTEQADQDLIELSAYVSTDSPQAGFRLIDRVFQKCQLLAENPALGVRRDELSPGLRSHVVGNYLVFYEPTEYGIQVIRIVHGARDLESLFSDQDR
jgi:toxin ParE1/3/4